MADIINIIQEPVSDTAPTIEIIQPFIVQSGSYYYGWEFNLVNGENNYTVYQKNVGNDVEIAAGASVILGGNNTIGAQQTVNDVIIIGDNNFVNYDDVLVFGRHLTASHSAAYYGMYNGTVGLLDNVIIAAGSSTIPFNAIRAGIDAGNHKYVILADNSSIVYVPVQTGSSTVNMKDIKTAFVERGTENQNYLYGRGYNQLGGYEKKYSLSSDAEDETILSRDSYGRTRVHVKYSDYDDSSIEDNNDTLYVPNIAYMNSLLSLKVDKTATIAGLQIGTGIDADSLTTHLVYCSNEGIDELFE